MYACIELSARPGVVQVRVKIAGLEKFCPNPAIGLLKKFEARPS